MKMLSANEISVLTPHHPVEHVAHHVSVGVVVSHAPKFRFPAQIQCFFKHHAVPMFRRPVPQSPNPLPHDGIVNVPNTPADVEKKRLQMLASISDFQPGVEEATNQNNCRKQRLPRDLRSDPAVGVDGFQRVVRIDGESRVCVYLGNIDKL